MSGLQEPYPPQQPGRPRGLPPLPERQPRQSPEQDSDDGGQQGGRRRARGAVRARGRSLHWKPGGRRPLVLIAGGLALLTVLGTVIFVHVAGSTSNQARGLAEDFTDLVIAGDTAKAYREYLDPALQEQLSKEQFMTGVGTLKLDQSCEPAFSGFTVDSDGGTRQADVTGLITCADRKTDLSYRFEGADRLKITSITLRPAD